MPDSFEEALDAVVGRRVREELSAFERRIMDVVKPAAMAVLLLVSEAAAHARVTQDTIRIWIRRGYLTPVHAGRGLRVNRQELDHFLSSGPPKQDEMDLDEKASSILNRRKNNRGGTNGE